MSAIELDNVSVILGHHGHRIQALRQVSASLAERNIIGLIGPSGAGKTTLIRAIVGRQKISGGKISVFSRPGGSAELRRMISYMTQERSVYPDLTVVENLRYFATMFGLSRREAAEDIHRILVAVHLQPQANQLFASLSGGQKQRVSLAVALIGQPKLMVLDEPTVGLDPLLREQLWELFRQLRDHGATLIISSHVMEEAERCDDLILIRDGQLLAHDKPAALRNQTQTTTVEQAFLKLVEEA